MPDPIPPPVPVVSASVEPTPPATGPVIVTLAANRAPAGMTAATAVGHPDVIIKVVQPLMIITVRAARVFLQTLMGLLTAGTVAPKALPAADFAHLLLLCASLSVAPAAYCIGQNALELLGKLDQKYPTLSG
jgi:hypothetical protein